MPRFLIRGRCENELEALLRRSRPMPRQEFAQHVLSRVNPPAERGRSRFVVALALTVVAFGVFGAFGGIGYASKAVSTTVHNIGSAGKPSASFRSEFTPAGKGDVSVVGSDSQARDDDPSDDEYGDETTICHQTGSTRHPWVLISVSNSSLPTHIADGDTLPAQNGTCPGP